MPFCRRDERKEEREHFDEKLQPDCKISNQKRNCKVGANYGKMVFNKTRILKIVEDSRGEFALGITRGAKANVRVGLIPSRWLIVSGLLVCINGYRLLKLGGLVIIGCSVCRMYNTAIPIVELFGNNELVGDILSENSSNFNFTDTVQQS
ncbi:hypothetical protein PUN28_019334 [Cardiocondyla obscurior]|uniref:Uncharacterized protein n=1 Tax=Cardiocondyla obscurior TaxID=286306 RepID=A0AAW2EEZ9_9HYME